jgi:hypothetical protein
LVVSKNLTIFAERLQEGCPSFVSAVLDDIKKTITDCQLDGVENISYLQAIKRVIGMTDKPLAN